MMAPGLCCLACDETAVAVVATGDAAIRAADDHSVCEIQPQEHDETGFRYYVHAPDV